MDFAENLRLLCQELFFDKSAGEKEGNDIFGERGWIYGGIGGWGVVEEGEEEVREVEGGEGGGQDKQKRLRFIRNYSIL